MRIAIDARTATEHFPGIGRYVVNLTRGLIEIAPELGLSLLRDPSASARSFPLPDAPRVACAASPFSIRQQWIVPAALRRLQAEVYHSPYYLMPYRPDTPTALTCYDTIPLIYPQYFSGAQRLIYRLANTIALKVARIVFAISEATRADLARLFHIRPDRIRVTPLAADVHLQPPSAGAIEAARRKYGLPDAYVLYLGINKPHKNLSRLVQAWRELKTGRGAVLTIAGYWDARYSQVKTLVEEAGLKHEVVFLGPIPEADLPALYGGAALFVYPSLYEGFGLPVLEAMACGAPVACSDASSLPEVAGAAGLLFDPLSVESIADAIARALRDADLRADLRRRGLARASQFTWQRTAQQTLEAYRWLT